MLLYSRGDWSGEQLPPGLRDVRRPGRTVRRGARPRSSRRTATCSARVAERSSPTRAAGAGSRTKGGTARPAAPARRARRARASSSSRQLALGDACSPPRAAVPRERPDPRLPARRLRRRHLRVRQPAVLREHRRHPVEPADRRMARTANGGGYWLLASDGGIFNFGNAQLLRIGGRRCTSRSRSSTWSRHRPGRGYWLAESQRQRLRVRRREVLRLGRRRGTSRNRSRRWPSTPTGHGYWLATRAGPGPPVRRRRARTARPAR